jgi:signal transduction histidine kinase
MIVFLSAVAITIPLLVVGSRHPLPYVRFGFVVAMSLVVLGTLSALRLLTPEVFFGAVVGLIVVGLAEAARELIRPKRPYPLRTSLFRGVFFTLLALFGVVVLAVWWRDQRVQRDQSWSSADEALFELKIAYRDQPALIGPHATVPNGPDPDGRGLWFDAAAYLKIKKMIGDAGGAGITDSGTSLLSGRQDYPSRQIVPPSVLADPKMRSRVTTPAYATLDLILPPLSLQATTRQLTAYYRRAGDYLKEHGWKIGQTTLRGDPRGSTYDFAVWRTGPDTTYYVLINPRKQADAWYVRPLQFGLGGIYIYALLAPFAAIAAWYLNRRIVRPVEQVAAASVELADGRLPEPIPEQGAYELETLAASFNLMAAKLKHAEATEQQFLLSVSHELKTPLTAIDGYAELLADGSVPAAEAASVLAAESGRLQRLVADLLDLGRMRQSTFNVRREPVDLQRVADEVARRYAPQAREYGVELKVAPDVTPMGAPGEWRVIGDEDRLVQVLSNLVENAIRCTPAKGRVAIEVSPGRLRVRDTGPGLDPADLAHAFERFYLYDRCKAEKLVGTGLGLAIVKELTGAMGGTVRVDSAAGAGTTFTVELPTAD